MLFLCTTHTFDMAHFHFFHKNPDSWSSFHSAFLWDAQALWTSEYGILDRHELADKMNRDQKTALIHLHTIGHAGQIVKLCDQTILLHNNTRSHFKSSTGRFLSIHLTLRTSHNLTFTSSAPYQNLARRLLLRQTDHFLVRPHNETSLRDGRRSQMSRANFCLNKCANGVIESLTCFQFWFDKFHLEPSGCTVQIAHTGCPRSTSTFCRAITSLPAVRL